MAGKRGTVTARVSVETWRERVAEWERSGLSGERFAAQLGVNPHSLSWWKWKLGTGARAKGPSKSTLAARPAFVPVVLHGATTETSDDRGVEVVLPRGHVVRVRAPFDEALFLRVISLLEAP